MKLVIAGPMGAGKTTFIRALSEVPVVETEAFSQEKGAPTTVALDFGLLRVDGLEVHLFGTPGQERFSFMWEVLMQGALGFLLLVAGDDPGSFPKARRLLDQITSQFPVPYLVGVTKQDLPRVWRPEEVAEFFFLSPGRVVGLSALRREEALRTLLRLLETVREGRAV